VSARSPVVVGHDGHALGPLRAGEALARALGLPLVLGCAYHYEPVVVGPGATGDDRSAPRALRAEATLDAARRLVHVADVDCRVLPADGAAESLRQLAAEVDAAAVVVGPDLRGEVTREVLGHAHCPVVVAPAEALVVAPQVRVVGVAYDGSVASRFALSAAACVAAAAGATLRILAATGRRPTSRCADDLGRAAAQVPGATVPVETRVLHGRAAAELRRACEDLDLLACGSRGHGRLLGALLGSVSTPLVDDPVCPVLVVPPIVRRRGHQPLGLSTAGTEQLV